MKSQPRTILKFFCNFAVTSGSKPNLFSLRSIFYNIVLNALYPTSMSLRFKLVKIFESKVKILFPPYARNTKLFFYRNQ